MLAACIVFCQRFDCCANITPSQAFVTNFGTTSAAAETAATQNGMQNSKVYAGYHQDAVVKCIYQLTVACAEAERYFATSLWVSDPTRHLLASRFVACSQLMTKERVPRVHHASCVNCEGCVRRCPAVQTCLACSIIAWLCVRWLGRSKLQRAEMAVPGLVTNLAAEGFWVAMAAPASAS